MRDDIHIILDSVACSEETQLKDDPRVHVVRLIMRHGEKEWLDGTMPVQEMFDLVEKTGVLAKTSQPSLGYMVEVFSELAKQGKKAIYITLSSVLSGTYQTACMAAQQVMKEIAGSDIRVVDSKICASPVSGMAIDLLKLIDEGKSLDEIELAAQDMVNRTVTLFSVNTLEYLHKGGRIGAVGAFLGSIFGIRPIVMIREDGVLKPVDKCRTRKKVLNRMLELISEEAPIERIYVCHANTPEDAEYLAQAMESRFPGVDILKTSIGSVLAAHLGPGVIGLFVRRKP